MFLGLQALIKDAQDGQFHCSRLPYPSSHLTGRRVLPGQVMSVFCYSFIIDK